MINKGITGKVEYVDTRTEKGWNRHEYKVTLRRTVNGKRRQFTAMCYCGLALPELTVKDAIEVFDLDLEYFKDDENWDDFMRSGVTYKELKAYERQIERYKEFVS